MNKTDLLLQMMEQPHQYTAEEWQDILADDECRELYTLMSMTQSAVDAARTDKEVTDEMIDEEWQRLSSVQSSFQLRKFAAIFVGILMLSGIAFAAIHIVSHSNSHKEKDTVAVSDASPLTRQSPLPQDTIAAPQPKLYENVPLSDIFNELSAYYHIKVEYRNDATRQIRLFYQWKPEYSIEKVVDMLNNFEWLQLELENDTLYVSSTVEPQS